MNSSNWFGENISNIFTCSTISQFNLFRFNLFSHKLMLHLNMSRSGMLNWIMCQLDWTLIITLNSGSLFLLCTNIFKNAPQPNGFTSSIGQWFILKLYGWQRNSWLFLTGLWHDTRTNVKIISRSRFYVIRIPCPIRIRITCQLIIKCMSI